MKRSGATLIALLSIASPTVHAAAPDVAADDKRLADCKALLALDDEARKNADGLEKSCADLRTRNADLEKRNAELERLTSEDTKTRALDLKLALESKRDLTKTVQRMEKALDACALEEAAPWYGRWELWVGAAAGLAVGAGVGYAVGRL